MRNSIPITIVLFSFLSCNFFSKNRSSKPIAIKHVSVSNTPMICEEDNKSFFDLTDSLLSESKLQQEEIKSIQDLLQHYYLVDSLVSNHCLVDEVIFTNPLSNKFDKAQDIDSLKLIISRDFDNMTFDSYGFVSSGNIRSNISMTADGFWEIENQLVKVKEDAATKELFLVTKNGRKISFMNVVPLRSYITDVRFKEQLIVYYTNKRVYSITTSSLKTANEAHLVRLAENLQKAKSI